MSLFQKRTDAFLNIREKVTFLEVFINNFVLKTHIYKEENICIWL